MDGWMESTGLFRVYKRENKEARILFLSVLLCVVVIVSGFWVSAIYRLESPTSSHAELEH